MGVPMCVPIFAQCGAARVRPHGATGLDPSLGICWDQLDHSHDCELKFSRIFQKKDDKDHFSHFGPWRGLGTPLRRGHRHCGTLLGSIWGSLSLISTPYRVLTFGTPYISAREPVVHLQTTSSFGKLKNTNLGAVKRSRCLRNSRLVAFECTWQASSS